MRKIYLALSLLLTSSNPSVAGTPSEGLAQATAKEQPMVWWTEMRNIANQVRSEKGIEAMFYSYPQLAARFANFDRFVDYFKKWSNRIPIIPEKELNSSKAGISWEQKLYDNGQTVYMTFQNQDNPSLLTIMRISWEGDKVSDLFFMKAIQGGVGQETYRYQDRYYDPYEYYRRRLAR